MNPELPRPEARVDTNPSQPADGKDPFEGGIIPDAPSERVASLSPSTAASIDVLHAVADKGAEDVPSIVASDLIAKGLLLSLATDTFESRSAQAATIDDVRVAHEKAVETVAVLQKEEAQLNYWANSPLASAYFWLTLRPGKLELYAQELEVKIAEREEAETKVESLDREITALNDLVHLLEGFTSAGDRYLALTELGAEVLHEADSYSTKHANSALDEIINTRQRWEGLIELWNSAYNAPNVSRLAATELAAASERLHKSLDGLLSGFDVAYSVRGIGAQTAAYFASQSATFGIPIERYIEGFKEVYAVPNLNAAAATQITAHALRTGTSLDTLVSDWRAFYQVSGLNSYSAALLATVSNGDGSKRERLSENWSEAWKVSGLCSHASSLLAIAALEKEVPISDLIGAWRVFWDIKGCDSPASAILAIASVCDGMDPSSLTEAFIAAYRIRGIDSIPAARLARLAVSTEVPVEELINRFKEAYGRKNIDGDAAASLVLAFSEIELPFSNSNDQVGGSSYESSRAYESTASSSSDSFFNTGHALIGDMIDDGSINLSGGFFIGGMFH